MAESYETMPELEEDSQKGRFLTFVIGKETYGIEIRYVTEIIGLQDITEMPDMPDYLKGIINLRGTIIPVMDVRLRFGKQPRNYDDRTCIIVIDCGVVAVGLTVDSVSEVLTLPEQDIAELPGIGGRQNGGYIKNVGKAGDTVILIIECEKLLSAQDLKRLAAEP